MKKLILLLTALLILSSLISCSENQEVDLSSSAVHENLMVLGNGDDNNAMLNDISSSEISTAVTTNVSEVTSVTSSTTTPVIPKKLPDVYSIKFPYIFQGPELPTGCEVTSLTMLLNYLGFDAEKTDLSDNYLEKDYEATKSIDEAFLGDPRWDGGYGCNAPVIVKTAEKYLKYQKSSLKVENITGTEFEDLYKYIADDTPVIVWASINLMEVDKYFCYKAENGEDVYWYNNEHCMVLCGFDKERNLVTAADPLSGLMLYDADRFKYIYEELDKQAIIIK